MTQSGGAERKRILARAKAWGIEPGFEDFKGDWQETPLETQVALLEVMDAGEDTPPGSRGVVLRRGESLDLAGTYEVRIEDGGKGQVEGGQPVDLPFGYHRISLPDRHGRGRSDAPLIVSPGTCYLPDDLSTWGWGVQLYSVHSESSWGIGDLGDLGKVARWARGTGAGMLLLNPLHAAAPEQASPYYPSSRCFRNPLYIDVEAVAADMGATIDVEPGRSLNATDVIDRVAVHETKMHALEELWGQWKGSPEFDRFCADAGDSLVRFAQFAAKAEAREVSGGNRVRFHMWLQWILRKQLANMETEIDVVHDLAIGADPAGADAWVWQEAFAQGVTIGAPPDEFATEGQNWGMPPFDPWKLREEGYEPFIETVRAGLSSGAGIRVDHVMGLFRLWWIPEGASAADGAYVRYPAQDLLNILALESQRARAYVVGEDLGTVEDKVRDEMAERNMMSYRVMWFESDPPTEFPELALAAATNHDLPTIAGIWTGADLQDQKEIGLEGDEDAETLLRERLRNHTDVGDDADVEEVIVRAYTALGEAPSRIKVATLEDAFEVERRPNQPGTMDERPNWSMRLPMPVEGWDEAELPKKIGDALS